MKKNNYTPEFSKSFFINFFSGNSFHDLNLISDDLERYFDIFIFGRCEGIFLNFLYKNKISLSKKSLWY